MVKVSRITDAIAETQNIYSKAGIKINFKKEGILKVQLQR
jgi:hypothetical protein